MSSRRHTLRCQQAERDAERKTNRAKDFAVSTNCIAMAKNHSPNLSVRIPVAVHRRLVANANVLGTTPGLYAKQLLIERIENYDVLELVERLDGVDDAVAALRRDVAIVLEALLLNLPNKPFTREQVIEFVTTKLARLGSGEGA